jgi:ketosteroid isomerase-like protein
MKSACLSLAIACAGLVGCARTSFDPAAEQASLLKRDAEWASAASAGRDVERIISYWTDDALVIPPGQPVLEGKAAIRNFVTESLRIPGFKIHWVSDKVSFSPDGQLAHMRGANEMTVPGPDGKLITVHGRGVTIWRRDLDGQWRCVVDIWNDPPASASVTRPATR